MSEEKGRKILLICMVFVFISIFIENLIYSELISIIIDCLIFSLFFSLTYRGINWARICLFIILLLYFGLLGLYCGIMNFGWGHHPASIIIIIMSLLNASIGFILLLNKSVQAFVKRQKS